jgi:hypothetical protein
VVLGSICEHSRKCSELFTSATLGGNDDADPSEDAHGKTKTHLNLLDPYPDPNPSLVLILFLILTLFLTLIL